MRRVFIGIDFGTTNCKVALVDRREDPYNELVENLNIPQFMSGRTESTRGQPYLPSVVYFDKPTEVYVGEYAKKDMLVRRPEQTIRSIKRLMGRTWVYSPFDGVNWSPEGIAAIILRKLKQAIEQHLQQSVEAAVITVPASFNSNQRRATRRAAGLAGFDPSQINLIDEPSAAILDYVARHIQRRFSYISYEEPQAILVFDMGGGTLDVSIVQTEPRDDTLSLGILARSRYTELAGNDFDLRLTAYLLNVFEASNHLQVADLPAPQKLQVMSSLLNLAEDLKMLISNRAREGKVYLHDSREPRIKHPGREVQYGEKILGKMPELGMGYKAHFERIWTTFFDQDREQASTIYTPIKSALAEAFPGERDPRRCIDLVLLHGGMSELPHIVSKIRAYFSGKDVHETPDLMNSVARGAAIYDAMLNDNNPGFFGNIRMCPQPVFEAVFLEQYRQGLQLLIPKTARPDHTGEISLTVPAGRPSRMPVSLYRGFHLDDPFITLDQELAIVFEKPPKENETIHLGWQILTDRTIEYWWRAENGERQPLHRLAAQGRDLTAASQDFSAQQKLLEQLVIG